MPVKKITQPLSQWLALIHAPGIGRRTVHQLLDKLDSIDAIFGASRQQLEQAGLNRTQSAAIKQAPVEAIRNSEAWLSADNNSLITWQDEAYPELLRQIPDPPIALFTCGDTSLLHYPQLAIVGSRNPTRSGRQNAVDFAHSLAASGIGITSGLAAGIDTASHQGALDANGITIAVTGTGLDRVYPATNRDLAHRIAEHGLLVTEFPPGTSPLPGNFPRRNRIISGLALGTLIVEAAAKSGSLITARLASEQGREVFAIPGSIHNPLSRGCHELIRQGAKLVETAEHIIEEIAPLLSQKINTTTLPGSGSENNSDLDKEYLQLLESIGHDPISINDLIEHSGLTPESVSSMLLILELKGYVESIPGGRYCRMPTSSN